MVEVTEILKRLEVGLVERLDAPDLKDGITNSGLVLGAVEERAHLYNCLGAIYPLLSRGEKTQGLRLVLRQMDGIRYDKVSLGHTPYIRDPQLLSDIGESRRLYWPGLHDEEKLWKGKKDFKELKEEIIGEDGLFKLDKVTSDFVVAYALLRSDFTNFGEDYVQAAHPGFLKRVLKGIVTLRFAEREDDIKIEKGMKRLQELLPKSLHDQIDPIRKEADWTIIKETVR